jgi:hypothetical protein
MSSCRQQVDISDERMIGVANRQLDMKFGVAVLF